jgi:glycosyltransferase involved in cell wall biosynthesis
MWNRRASPVTPIFPGCLAWLGTINRMKPLRLLVLIEATSVTGPAKNLLQFAECLAAQGAAAPVEMALLVFRREGLKDGFSGAAEARGIRVFQVAERRAFDFRVIPQLRSILSEFRPDALETHAVKSHFLTRLAGLHKQVPWIAFNHGYTWPALRVRLYNQLDRWSLRAPRKVVTVSLPFKEELIRFGVDPARIEVVHNAIDPRWGEGERTSAARAALRAQLGIGEAEKVIVIVGRLSAEKDHQTLLRAFHALTRAGEPPARLLIVGGGPERPRIEETARALNLGAGVLLTGQAPSAAPYYGIADLAALSSVTEGSPNALLEAMAAGVPVVATAVGGIPEMVTHGESALLIQPGDAPGMAQAMKAILSDDRLGKTLAANALSAIRAKYSPAARTARLVAIYQAVAEESGTGASACQHHD